MGTVLVQGCLTKLRYGEAKGSPTANLNGQAALRPPAIGIFPVSSS
jgi:hypothetical protein